MNPYYLMNLCSEYIIPIYSGLSKQSELVALFDFPGLDGIDGWCFRLKLKTPISTLDVNGRPLEVTHISISLPPENSTLFGGDIPVLIETALFSRDMLVYSNELEHGDVCKYYPDDENTQLAQLSKKLIWLSKFNSN